AVRAYAAGPARFLVMPSGAPERAWLWESGARRLTSLGTVRTLRVPGAGWLIEQHDAAGSLRLCDIDPLAPQLRTLWKGAPDRWVYAVVLGRQQDALLLQLKGSRESALLW